MIIPTYAALLPLWMRLSEALLGSSVPSVKRPSFPRHTLLQLADGNWIPSPAYGLGSANYQQNATLVLAQALENGWRHIDGAAIYGNEESMKAAIAISGVAREDLYITTKYDALNGEDVRAEFDKSLKKIGVSYVDLYLIHFPKFAVDGGGIAKVWAEFEKLKDEGLVRSIGVSNYEVEDLTELLLIAKHKPVVNQIRYHSYNAASQAPTLALCALNNITIEAYSSLSPITKFPGGPADAVQARIASRLSDVSGGLNVTEGQAILDWIKTKNIVAVTTSSKKERLEEQLSVFDPAGHFPPLTAEDIVAYETAGPGWDQRQ